MKFISGKKLSMTQIWVDDKVMAVTPVLAGPCTITQVKSKVPDGYEALQLAYGKRKSKNIHKPQLGHYKKTKVFPQYVREFRTTEASKFKEGDVVSVGTFAVGDIVRVTGTSKGRGFQGVIKRHHFHGFKKTHGNKDQERMPGSIGAKGPAHVFKGTKMGGRMGNEQVTTTNLEIMSLDIDKNILFIKGAIPGAINGFVFIRGIGDLQVNLIKQVKSVESEVIKETQISKSEIAPESKITEIKVQEEVKTDKNSSKEEKKVEEKVEKKMSPKLEVEAKESKTFVSVSTDQKK